MSHCIFCKIIEKTIPANIVYEDDQLLAFHDIHPKAPVHILVIPKKHIASLVEAQFDQDANLLGYLMTRLPIIAAQLGLTEGFRTIFNTGPAGGQEVYHLHAHLLGEPVKTF
jgi:histidine triad (HIT) family protein